MIRLLRRLLTLFALASAAVQAAPMSPDPSGYWYNPNESGWGVAIAQQNETLFVTLLVYDEQRRAAWYVASGVSDPGNGVFTGALYQTSGPWFGAGFDPAAVQVQAVGTVTLRYTVVAVGQAAMQLTYTVNGVSVTKALLRLTWSSNAINLAGNYAGGMTLALSPLPQPTGCVPQVPTFLPPGGNMRVTLPGDSISFAHGEGTDLVTIILGTYQQSGQFGVVTGGIFRGNVGANPLPKIGVVTISNLVATTDGFVGHIQVVKELCVYEGTFGGIRQSP